MTETNKLLDFVLVPEDFSPESGDPVGEVLKALGLTKPDIAFDFHKGGKLADGVPVVDQRVRAVMDGISAACAQTHSIYMLRAPYAGNRLAEIVCKSAQQQGPDCPVVGFFHLGTLTRIDPSREEDKRDEEFCQKLASRHQYLKKKAQNQETGGGAELGPEPEDPYEALDECYKQGQPGLPIKECWDAQRVMVYDSVLHPNATAGSVKEVGTTIDVSCQPTMVEELLAKARAAGDRFPNSSKDYHIAMLDKVTHAVVFADQDFPGKKKAKGEEEGQIVPNVTQGCDTQNNFADMLQDQLPTGVIAAGGTRPLFDSCVECLKAGRPIFCFRGTGGSSSTIAKLIDFGKLKKGQPAGAGLQSRPPAGKKKLEEFIAREFSPDAPVTGDARDFGPTVQRNILRDARALACNFPEHFNPASALVIEVGAPEGKEFELTKFSPEAGDSVDILQDQITKVMASVYDNVPELGGVEADARSVRHALALQSHLKRGAARYRREGSLIITIMRILGVATSVAAALRSDPQYQGGVADSDWLHWVSMALPLMLAVSASVLTTYRPIQKFAALSSAAHEIESEIYRFRTRTRPYYATKSTASGKGHRQLFSSTCDRILATHMTGDASLSAERLVDADRWLALTPDANNNVSTKSLAPVAPAAEKGRKGKLGTPSDGAGVALAAGDGPEVEMPTVTQAGSANEQQQQQQQPKKSETSTLAADEYTIERALPELKKAQRAAPRISRQLKALQLLVIIGAAVMVILQSEVPAWTPVVLTVVATIEYVISYQQLESTLPAVNATALAITRVLVWWDGLSLIQQRMPNSKDRLVDIVESALVMQHAGFVQGAISNLGKDMPDGGESDRDGGKAAGETPKA